MLIIFFDIKRVIVIEWVLKSQIANQKCPNQGKGEKYDEKNIYSAAVEHVIQIVV